MLNRTVALLIATAGVAPLAQAQITSVDLGTYQLKNTYTLALQNSPLANEASAVTWNGDTGTLFVVEDEGKKIYEVSTTGTVLGSMSLTGFEDTEGLTYMGGGKFAVAEERLRSIYQLSYTAGTTLSRSSLQAVNLGSTVGNIGVEGVSYDPIAHNFVFVKEKQNSEVNLASNVNFAAHTATVSSLFNPASLGVADLADVQVLSTVASLAGGADQDNLLILSQESQRLMEVSRTGTVLSYYNLAALGTGTAEGVTIDAQGNIYVVAEPEGSNGARLFVLAPPAPVPLPAAAWLMLSGLGALGGLARRRRENAAA